MSQIKVVSTKFVKKLEGTDFYEMRISVGNEYRVILFTIDSESFIEADEVLLLNGFMKKSAKEYKAQIQIAENILQKPGIMLRFSRMQGNPQASHSRNLPTRLARSVSI